ncbi:MAG TPA: hemerythrin domain-containing protein, partial [Candidatus Binatia bacterium]|nr:hemerythrin domain-containing protein [Candidatus Binatia bacterium]
ALGRLRPTGAEGLRLRAQEVREFFDKQLTPHFRAEEKFLFPYMREAVPQSAPLLDELIRDHEAFRQAIKNLVAGAALSKLIFDIGDLLERHIRKEERELFPLFEKYVDSETAGKLGEDIKRTLTGEENT